MFIILEGVDRSGKSTVADYYKSLGYVIVHVSAPDKKFAQPGYVGPSYLDWYLDMYMAYNGKDVVFDRSNYGELSIWPHVYGRTPQLDEEAIDILREYEDRNDVQRILMWDDNAETHFARCVANKEPLTKSQFLLARKLYDKMATEHNFTKMTLPEFLAKHPTTKVSNNVDAPQVISNNVELPANIPQAYINVQSFTINDSSLQKLDKANAIDAVLSKPILKRKEPVFISLENDIRCFLQSKLDVLLGNSQPTDFTDQERNILKLYASRILEKSQNK